MAMAVSRGTQICRQALDQLKVKPTKIKGDNNKTSLSPEHLSRLPHLTAACSSLPTFERLIGKLRARSVCLCDAWAAVAAEREGAEPPAPHSRQLL